jgi:TPR repeat protein
MEPESGLMAAWPPRTLNRSSGHNPPTCELAFRNFPSGAPLNPISPSSGLGATQRQFWGLDQCHSNIGNDRNQGSKWYSRAARKYYHEWSCHRDYYDGRRDIWWSVAKSCHSLRRPIFPTKVLRLARARQSQQEPTCKPFSLFPPLPRLVVSTIPCSTRISMDAIGKSRYQNIYV